MTDDLKDRYQFYIMNPRHTRGVEYSLWIQADDREYPILSSNTGGFATFASRDSDVGDGIEPTDEFLTLLSVACHEALSAIPHLYWDDSREFALDYMDTAESVYDGKVRRYEAWAAEVLAQQFTMGDELIPELEPLAQHAASYSEFDLPILHGDGDE